jgi:hypothetical protein
MPTLCPAKLPESAKAGKTELWHCRSSCRVIMYLVKEPWPLSASTTLTTCNLVWQIVDVISPGALGLRNEGGQYNCFLNAVLQCLWKCTAFRKGALALPLEQVRLVVANRALEVAKASTCTPGNC